MLVGPPAGMRNRPWIRQLDRDAEPVLRASMCPHAGKLRSRERVTPDQLTLLSRKGQQVRAFSGRQ